MYRLGLALLVVFAGGTARAESALELGAGVGVFKPFVDQGSDFEGARALSISAAGLNLLDRLGLEARWVRSSPDPWSRMDRIRAMANVGWSDGGADRRLTVRLGAGLEVHDGSRTYTSSWPDGIPMTYRTSERSYGFAVEPSGTCAWRAGPMWLGGQVALPISVHDTEAPNSEAFSIKYLGLDVEVRLVAQLAFD